MSEHILHTTNVKRLERSRTDKVLAGVCSGLGRYFDLTPAVFRLGFVVLTVLGGAGVLVYIAAVLVMPKEGEDRSIAEDILVKRRDHPARLVALGLVAVAILSLLARTSTWPGAGAAWFLILVGGIALLWSTRRGVAAVLLGVLGAGLVAAVAAVIVAFAWFDVSLGDGVGQHTYTPTAATSTNYDLGIGHLRLDLTSLPAGSRAHLTAHVGMGELRLVVPHGTRVVSHVKAGSIDAVGQHDDGTDVRVVTGTDSGLTVDASVGAGHLDVLQAP
jgi:phage shock protein PspC (stress-responsive transcriptional regulator)